MASTENESDSVVLDGGEFGRLTFDREGDRYRHAWSFEGSTVRIVSAESSAEEIWPSSPPLQQIHSQSFADGREVIFGVGMAGRGHWSASFTLVPDLKCWIVELACRSSVQPERLASTYQLEGVPSQALDSSQPEICLDPKTGIVIEAIAPGSQADLSQSSLMFSPKVIADQAATIQWAFRLRVG